MKPTTRRSAFLAASLAGLVALAATAPAGGARRWSVGSSLGELAKLMVDLGAVHAMNLDGGGSSAMWVDDSS